MERINYYLNLLKEKDLYTYYHSIRVMNYSLLIGKSLNYDDLHLIKLKYAALLHDIGKLFISNEILNKPDKLTFEEYEIIKKHTVYAKYILNGIDINDIIYHHERLNGSGYYHLSEEFIPINSQIIAVADSFDAMTSKRNYGDVISYDDAFDELFNCSTDDNKLYNRKLVENFYNLSKENTNMCKTKHY